LEHYYADALEFVAEPLRIDALIIKDISVIHIKKYMISRMFMGGPGGPRPPGGGVTGEEPPLKGVAEAQRAGARGRLPPSLEWARPYAHLTKPVR
jgi:hypothetical protein